MKPTWQVLALTWWRAYGRWITYLAVLLCAFAAKSCYDREQQEKGALAVYLKATQDSLRDADHRADSLAQAYRVDTVRLTKTLVRRDTVLRVVDKYLTDTVPVPVEVVRQVIKADSQAIHACLVTVATCEEQKAVYQRQIGLLGRERDLWRHKASPSLLTRARGIATWLALGYLAGKVAP